LNTVVDQQTMPCKLHRGLHEIFSKTPEELKVMGQASRKIVADFSPEQAAAAIYGACRKVVSETAS